MSETAEPIVQLTNARKSFGATRAVDGLSFAVGRGEMFGIIGPDGAGKTTALRLICGLLKTDTVDGGTVRVRGIDPFVARRVTTWRELRTDSAKNCSCCKPTPGCSTCRP